MAIHLDPKAPTEALEYRWAPELTEGDGLASFTLSATGATIATSAQEGDEVVFKVTGGTEGATAEITATATSNDGFIHAEVLYLPIRGRDDQFLYTGSQIVNFALRKVAGLGRVPRAAEQADALERLSDMLAEWAGQGADLGVRLPVQASDQFYIPDAHANVVKQNLLLRVYGLYGRPIPAETVMMAARGLQQVKQYKLATAPRATEFY